MKNVIEAKKPLQYFCGDALTEDYVKELVQSVKNDYLRRAEDRKQLERQWQLNMNFLAGRQYVQISPLLEIEEIEKRYVWQSREVFNHIAPIVETRCAKLAGVRPKMSVRAFGDEESDLYAAKMSSKILNASYTNLDLNNAITSATLWSEVTGTAFYKVVWDSRKGRTVGAADEGEIHEGDVSVTVCPPFEIFPENLYCENLERQKSIIHARALHTDIIEETWGQSVQSEPIDVFSLESGDNGGGRKKLEGYAAVIEKYELPTKKYPEGRLIIIAGDKLLHLGPLPYLNGENAERGYPFIKQCSIGLSGMFFGISIIERLIPLQRAYNAVKNRKHEFLNRIAAGVLAVEDGSTDTDMLEEEGLAPGRVIVYRQGSTPPRLLDAGNVPNDFVYEEERLLSEFKLISGVSDVMRNSTTPSSLTSGVAISLLIEQDDTRLSASANYIKNAVKNLGRHIIRLYKQFASAPRLMVVAGENNTVEQYYFDKKSLSSGDIVFDTENEISQSPAQKKSIIIDMLKNGILSDENGKLTQRMKSRIADIMGFSDFENGQDIINLNIKRAAKENLLLVNGKTEPMEIDDHELHIDEHIKYMLSGEFETSKSAVKTENFLEHIRQHKVLMALEEQSKGQRAQNTEQN
jgi:hypothetical protein